MFRRLFRSKFKFLNTKHRNRYIVLNSKGERFDGTSDLSYTNLKEDLLNKGYYIITIRENFFKKNNRKLKEKDLLYIFSNLDFLLNSSIRLIESIDIIINTTEKEYIKESLKDLKIRISKGCSFSDAVQNNIYKYPHIIYANLRSGEITGNLDKVCSNLHKYYEKKIDIKNILKRELRYPLILLIASFFLILFLFIFFFPIIEEIYVDNSIKITLLNSLLFKISYYIRRNLLIILSSILILNYFLFKFKKHIKNIIYLLLGKKFLRIRLIELISNLKLLLYSGINLHDSLIELSLIFKEDQTLNSLLEELLLSISRGCSIFDAIKKYDLGYTIETFIKIGEETGDLPLAVDRIYSYTLKKIDIIIERLTFYMEPIILFLVSIFILIILLSITRPILSFLDNIL